MISGHHGQLAAAPFRVLFFPCHPSIYRKKTQQMLSHHVVTTTVESMIMIRKFQFRWCAFLIVVALLEPSVQAGLLWGHPYQDRHFNLNSTPRSGNSNLGYASSSNGSGNGFTSNMEMPMSADMGRPGLQSGSGNGAHRPTLNAILRVWVPDGLSVEINGYATRLQSLAGINSNSRIFSLEGLDTDRVSPCDIVVQCTDQLGNSIQYRRALSVLGGGNYEVRFPRDFEPIVEQESVMETIHELPESVLSGPAVWDFPNHQLNEHDGQANSVTSDSASVRGSTGSIQPPAHPNLPSEKVIEVLPGNPPLAK